MNIGFVTIQVTSLENAIKFYKEVLDFEVVRRFAGGPQMEIVFMADKNGNQLEFIQRGSEKIEHNGLVSIGFNVENMKITEELLKKHNVEITSGPHTMPSGVTLLHAKDVNGVALGFVQRPQ